MLTVGEDPFKGMAFLIGQPAAGRNSGFKITYIKEDSQHYEEFGVIRYTVYVKKDGEEEVEWKSYERVPVSIEYFLPDGKPDEIAVG